MASPPYKVIWLSNVDNSFRDITNDIGPLPIYTDTGSGEVNSAIIIIFSNRGKYTTVGVPIQNQDLIQIQDTDKLGNTYQRNFIIKKIIPSESKQTGNRLELHCVGLEYNSQVSNFAKLIFAGDAFSACKFIQDQYNANKGIKQAHMFGLDDTAHNKIPNWTTNNYDFGANEEKAYTRLLQIIDKQGMPPEAGGAFDYFEIGTEKDTTLGQTFTFKIVSSGKDIATQGGLPIILDATQGGTALNIGETEGGIDDFKGSVINSWGESSSGSLPVGYSKFRGGQLTYSVFPDWAQSTTYPVGAKVLRFGTLYKSIVPNNQGNDPAFPPPNIYWDSITQAQYYGTAYIYSQWTNGRVGDLINCGSNLTGNNIGRFTDIGRGFFDVNIIKNDDSTSQTWADIADTQPPKPQPNPFVYPVPAPNNGWYQGFRVLCKGTGTAEFSGNDKNGVSFSNAIVEYDGVNWFVRYSARDNLRCAVRYEGTVYIFNNFEFGNGWHSMAAATTNPGFAGAFLDGNVLDCFHPYNKIEQSDIDPIDSTFLANKNSAVKVTYQFDSFLLLDPDTILNGGHSAEWYRFGAWLSFVFPFPPYSISQPEGGNSSSVGKIYGSNNDIKGPSLLDAQNMSITSDGLQGFCHGLSTEDLGPLSSFDFRIKMRATFDFSGEQLAGEANFKMGVAMGDINDNVVIQYGICPFNNNSFDMKFPLSQFVVYRGRTAIRGLPSQIIPPIGLSPVNSFEWRHVKWITIFTAESYDGEGRYNPFTGRFARPFNTIAGLPAGATNHKLEMWIDAMRFTKPLLVNSKTQGDKGVNIEPEFTHHEEIETYQQLDATVGEEFQRMSFTHQEYDLTTTLLFNIPFASSFYYYNPRVVPTQVPPDIPAGDPLGNGGANTIKLVNKRTEYSRTKPANGQGGALRRIIGVKRFGES